LGPERRLRRCRGRIWAGRPPPLARRPPSSRRCRRTPDQSFTSALVCSDRLDIESLQNRLLKVCCVPATSAGLPRVSFFFSFLFLLLWPLTALVKQTRQAVHAVKLFIFLDVYEREEPQLFVLFLIFLFNFSKLDNSKALMFKATSSPRSTRNTARCTRSTVRRARSAERCDRSALRCARSAVRCARSALRCAMVLHTCERRY